MDLEEWEEEEEEKERQRGGRRGRRTRRRETSYGDMKAFLTGLLEEGIEGSGRVLVLIVGQVNG